MTSRGWQIVAVLATLLVLWICVKLFIGVTRLAFLFAIAGIKITALLLVCGIAFTFLYLKLRRGERRK